MLIRGYFIFFFFCQSCVALTGGEMNAGEEQQEFSVLHLWVFLEACFLSGFVEAS